MVRGGAEGMAGLAPELVPRTLRLVAGHGRPVTGYGLVGVREWLSFVRRTAIRVVPRSDFVPEALRLQGLSYARKPVNQARFRAGPPYLRRQTSACTRRPPRGAAKEGVFQIFPAESGETTKTTDFEEKNVRLVGNTPKRGGFLKWKR